jgi:hypothetical protein
VAVTCASGGEAGVQGRLFAVLSCARRTATIPARRTATTSHGKPWTLGNGYTLGKGTRRTAKLSRTAMIQTHGKDYTHGKEIRRTAKQATHGKGLCRAYMARRTAKNSLPFATLPCFLCRASTLGKGFAVSFLSFAVRYPRTAKHCSPVV